MDQKHAQEAAEEAAQSDRVAVSGPVARQIGVRAQSSLDAGDALAEQEEGRPDDDRARSRRPIGASRSWWAWPESPRVISP